MHQLNKVNVSRHLDIICGNQGNVSVGSFRTHTKTAHLLLEQNKNV